VSPASPQNFFMMVAFAYVSVLSAVGLQAQALYVGAEQLVSVGKQATLQVSGSIDNDGDIFNQGKLYVHGDWQNRAQYHALGGLTAFTGTSPQQLNHNGQSFSRLRVSNEGGLNLTSDIFINQEIDLQEGIVSVASGFRVFFDKAAAIFGGSANSFIQGVAVHQGTGDKFFPIGTASRYMPMELISIRGNNPQLAVEANTPHPDAGSLVALDRVSNAQYWQVRELGGSFQDALVRVALLGDLDFNGMTGLVVAASLELEGEYISLGSSEVTGSISDGSLTSSNATSLPIITLGKSNEYSVESEILVPNAFAPGSAVKADRRLSIFAVNLVPDSFVFRIFDRWGQIVYETSSVEEARNTGWNGINQQTNEPAQFGVYSYYVHGVFSSGMPVEKRGTITLFR
jgi:hypothetical protein